MKNEYEEEGFVLGVGAAPPCTLPLIRRWELTRDLPQYVEGCALHTHITFLALAKKYIRPSPFIFRLLSNTFSDFGSVGRSEKKKKGRKKKGEEVWN